MCGIAGFIGKRSVERARILLTLEKMRNRGPDHQDYREFVCSDISVALLHSRLSIIDLDARSNQPFTIGNHTIVFNGELYNYLELRRELEGQGIVFRTTSDTEVLLQCYIEYGEDCVRHFEGMWSFAVLNWESGELFLSRDRFGEKPLYYLQVPNGLYFASEVKFLQSLSGQRLTPNERHLLRYLVNGYKALNKTEETFFHEVREVPYATNLLTRNGTDLAFSRYWSPVVRPADMTLGEAIDGTRYHLRESMKIRLRADVPLAFCLSGGIDSSALASIAAKELNHEVATFSLIDSDERYNEYENIMATIGDLGCKHTLIDIPQEEALPRLHRLIAYHDMPVSTITYYVHSFLSEAISRSGYKVAFSGTSADELFTGYYDHFILHLYEMRNHPEFSQYMHQWEHYIRGFVRNPYLTNGELYLQNPGARDHIYLNSDEFASYLKVDFSEPFVERQFCGRLLRNRMLNELFEENTPVILHEDDLNSMMYSVENRSPYLDSRLLAFAYSIPDEHLIRDGYAKYILREAVKGILNEKVRTDRMKKGFNASINSVIDFADKADRDYLLDEDAAIFQLVDRQSVERLMQRYPLPNSYSKFLFSFINARIFLETQEV